MAAASEPTPEEGPRELLLEAALDELDAGSFAILAERLREAGAVEVERLLAGTSGEGYRAIIRAVIPTELREEVEEAFIIHSTATSIRALPIDRLEIPTTTRTVTTRWGDVRLRLRIWRGRVLDARPVQADAIAISRESDVPLALVLGEATRLGEVFVGQHLSPD